MTPDQFREIRHEFGLTQAQLAPLLNLKNKVQISHLETGRVAIPWHISQLMRCYRYIGIKKVPDL